MPTPRSRSALRRRRPLFHWLLAGALALAAATAVAVPVRRAEEALARVGDLTPVLVADTDLPAGHVLTAADATLQPRPAALVPADALRAAAPGAVLRAATYRGEAIVAGRLAPAGVGPVAARLPAGSRAIAVPAGAGTGTPPLAAGDGIDLLATLEPGLTGAAVPTVTVVRGALVVHVGEESVTVAVPADDVARVAFAVGQGVVALVLRPDAPAGAP